MLLYGIIYQLYCRAIDPFLDPCYRSLLGMGRARARARPIPAPCAGAAGPSAGGPGGPQSAKNMTGASVQCRPPAAAGIFRAISVAVALAIAIVIAVSLSFRFV